MREIFKVSTDPCVPASERIRAAKQRLREAICETSLSRVGDELERLMMVSVRFETVPESEGDMMPGGSRLGGIPDLPKDMTWPESHGTPMAFLAQIRLDDVAPYDLDERLPKSGTLSFFYEADEQVWGFDPDDRGKWRVVYIEDNPAGLCPANPPEELPEECQFQACNVVFSNEITLPSWESKDVLLMQLTREEIKEFTRFSEEHEPETTHRLFGHPDQIQGEMALDCQLASNGINTGSPQGYSDPRCEALQSGADDWLLLMQIDSDNNTGMFWGDCGRVYFWIRRQELLARDFSNVWLVLQCC